MRGAWRACLAMAVVALALAALPPAALADESTPAPPTSGGVRTASPTVGTTHAPEACVVEATGTITTISALPCNIVPGARTYTPALPWSFEMGTNRVTWSWTDAGSTVTGTQSIIVVDRSPPSLYAPPKETLDTSTGTAAVPRATIDSVRDGTDDRPSTKPKPGIAHSPTALALGANKVTWTATDGADRQSTATQWIYVRDSVKPTIKCPPDARLQSGVPVLRSSVELGTVPDGDIADNIDADRVLRPTVRSNALDAASKYYPVGTTAVTWTVTDSHGNVGECTQEVLVAPLKKAATFPSDAGVAGTTFGASLASDGRLLFVGNPGHTHTTTSGTTYANAGEVIAYRLEDGDGKAKYAVEGTIPAPTPAANLRFGESLAVLPLKPDGVLAVGASGKDNNIGAVYLYSAKTLKLLVTDPNPNPVPNPNTATADSMKQDHFGASLAAMGDKLVVSAHMRNVGTDEEVGMVHVYSPAGSRLYSVANPAPAEESDRFGVRIAAHDDGTTERLYVGSRTHGATKGAVYIYDATGASRTAPPTSAHHALNPSGSTDTDYAETQIRAAPGGNVFVGEPYITSSPSWTGKIHHHSATGAVLGAIDPQPCCTQYFGTAFGVGGGHLYAPHYAPITTGNGAGPLRVLDATDRTGVGMFTDYPTSALTTWRLGTAVEPAGGGLVAVTEALLSSDFTSQRTRVHLLDLRTVDPTDPIITKKSSVPPEQGAGGQSQAQVQAQVPAEPTLSAPLAAPVLLSTERAGADGVRLTYNVAINPFEVDIDDYTMEDSRLEIVDFDVSGATITLTYVGGAGDGAEQRAGPPGVRLIGGIGHY